MIARCAALLLLAPITPVLGEGVPVVALSEGHRAMAKVGVGAKLPAMVAATPAGGEQPVAPLLAGRVGVVVLFDAARAEVGWMTKALLDDLGPDIATPYKPKGVTTVLVSVGGGPATVKDALSLVDPAGEAFAALGSGRLPRVYVVNKQSEIAWFDIEYSNSTRRELRQTLDALVDAKE
ncbi:MAG: hypothetical protein AAGJ46_15150 [Planctomycetota bacterium]